MPPRVILRDVQVRLDSLAFGHPLVPLAAVIPAAPLIILGRRERQVADLVLAGASNAEVAQELGMALRTVKAHLNKLYMRYGITTGSKRVQFVEILHQEGSGFRSQG
jgi:ATP/maltotriose-dependent transcriptional regulator MalT